MKLACAQSVMISDSMSCPKRTVPEPDFRKTANIRNTYDKRRLTMLFGPIPFRKHVFDKAISAERSWVSQHRGIHS